MDSWKDMVALLLLSTRPATHTETETETERDRDTERYIERVWADDDDGVCSGVFSIPIDTGISCRGRAFERPLLWHDGRGMA